MDKEYIEYIERKAVYDKLEKEKEYAKELWDLESNDDIIGKNMKWGIYCGFAHAIRIVNSIPYANVVEVRYGRVIIHEGHEDDYYEYCSECKTTNVHSGDNFCPNCGCKIIGIKYSNSKE